MKATTTTNSCGFDACDRPLYSRGLCGAHYQQYNRNLPLKPLRVRSDTGRAICSFEGCGRRNKADGLCAPHCNQRDMGKHLTPVRERNKARGESCRVCGHPVKAKMLCYSHYVRSLAGEELGEIKRQTPGQWGNWKTNHQGYIVRVRTISGTQSYQLQHRHVMEEHLGRSLRGEENVHHINGDRADNRLENLELWSTSQPSGQRVIDKLAWAREIIALYGTD